MHVRYLGIALLLLLTNGNDDGNQGERQGNRGEVQDRTRAPVATDSGDDEVKPTGVPRGEDGVTRQPVVTDTNDADEGESGDGTTRRPRNTESEDRDEQSVDDDMGHPHHRRMHSKLYTYLRPIL